MIRSILYNFLKIAYRILRPVLYLSNPEATHERMVKLGEVFGNMGSMRFILGLLFKVKSPVLKQTIHGIRFENPVGLAAGSDVFQNQNHFW